MMTWIVTLTRMVGGKPEAITRDGIVAGSQDEAVRKAKQGIPNAALYTQVQATQVGTDGNPVQQGQMGPADQLGQHAQQPQRAQQWDARGRPLPESAFPYVINVDASYGVVAESAKVTDIKIERRNGRIYIVVPNQRTMELFMKKLLESKHARAKIIAEGVSKSME